MKTIAGVTKSFLVVLLFFLSACAPAHIVNTDHLKTCRERVFHIGVLEANCPETVFTSTEEQTRLLKSIPLTDILRILADEYGLNINAKTNLSVKTSARHFVGWFSKSHGRQAYLENTPYDEQGDIVDVFYTWSRRDVPLMPIKYTLHYKVVVKSAGTILVKHEGDVGSFEYAVFSFKGEKPPIVGQPTEKLIENAKKIPETLQRDIEQEKQKNL